MTTVLYAGSFDPFTNGHMDILRKSASAFEKVLIAVAKNPEKSCILTPEERVELIKTVVHGISNVEVFSFDGLTVDFAKKHGAMMLIRGLRNSADFEYENQLAQINSTLNKNIHTVFFVPSPENACISSSAVRELILNKCNLTGFVPLEIADFLYKKFKY